MATAKRPKCPTSVESEKDAARDGKSEPSIVAMNAGNAAGAKGWR